MEVCTDFPRLFPWSDPVISSACSASVPLQPLHGSYGKCYHKRRMMMIFLCCDANWYTNMQWMTKTPIAESRTPITDVCADHLTFFRTTKTCRAGPAHELFSWWMYNSLRVCLFPLVIKWGHETGWWHEPFENARSLCLLELKKRGRRRRNMWAFSVSRRTRVMLQSSIFCDNYLDSLYTLLGSGVVYVYLQRNFPSMISKF